MPATHMVRDVDANEKQSKATATEKGKAKAARLRLMKERNENYLAEREVDESATLEIRVMTD